MPLGFRVREVAAKREDFTYYGRVKVSRLQDSSLEHKVSIGASPDTFVEQLHIEVEGISVEFVGENGNTAIYSADLMNSEGAYHERRNTKSFYILASLCGPSDPDEAVAAGFHFGSRSKAEPICGLEYDDQAPDFPDCLEGHIYKIAERWVTFGKNRETGEPIERLVPLFLQQMPDNFVYEGKVGKVNRGRKAVTEAAVGEATGGTEVTPGGTMAVASPATFFAAIDGASFTMGGLAKATAGNPGLNIDPYRSLIATKSGRAALAESGYIEVAESEDGKGLVEVVDATATLEDLEALLAAAPK